MAQIQFKVGDKVRLISAYPDGYTAPFDNGELKIGDIYTITTDWGPDYDFPYTLGIYGWDVSADMIELMQEEKFEMDTNIIQSLEVQIAELQQKLEEEKKKLEERKTPWKLTEENEEGFWANIVMGRVDSDVIRGLPCDLSTFATKEAAEGFLNVWHVMVMLRQQEGAGKKTEDGDGWGFDAEYEEIYAVQAPELFSLFPPFPSKELAQAALEAVGKERIIAAYKFLETGESA